MSGAIVVEVCATLLLKASEGFSRPAVGAVALAGYALALVLLSRSLARLPLGTAYAVWVGAGSVAVTAAGVVLFGDHLTPAGIAGVGLVALGVVVLNASGG